MDPSSHSDQFPSTSSSPLMSNFLLVDPAILPPQPNPINEAGRTVTHSSADYMELQRQYLQLFWQHQMHEMGHHAGHRQHELPLMRIKRIMKSSTDVKKISGETPILFSKACELFIAELTLRSWLHAEMCRRQTLLRTDVANSISHAEMLYFLISTIQPNEYLNNQPEYPQQLVMTQQLPTMSRIIDQPPPPL